MTALAQQQLATLDLAASSFLHNLTNPPPETQQEVNNLLRWFGRDIPLTGLTPRDIEEYCGLVGTNGEDTAARRIKLIRQFFMHVDGQGALDFKLAPHVKLRRAGRSQQPGAKKPQKERVQLTAEGHARMRERVVWLQDELVRVADDIKKAAADKDVRENAPLEAARQHQGQIMTQLREIEATLENAEVISELTRVAEARIRQGSRVTLRDLGNEREIALHLVDPSEVNPLGGRISTASPMGRALMEHTVGDEVTVMSPRGAQRYRITLIE
ncbi:MAG: hypothetical protein FJ315_00270 [SAR202 cluster bacterium]|nr:hypothetical protein [SAR202 cluster bacterium]